MLSAVGTGSVLFTPRVASVYRYELFWLLLLVVFFMWVMIREMARFSIVSGRTMLEGMHHLPGPRNWAVWLVFVPQLFAAAVGIAGLASVVGSALASFAPGDNSIYGIAIIVACTLFVSSGYYLTIERLSRAMALLLMLAAIAAAVAVFPNAGPVLKGLMPSWPSQPDYYVVLPWVGTILAGSMGIVWFGYWTATRGFGGGLVSQEKEEEHPAQERGAQQAEDKRPHQDPEERAARVRSWVRIMTGAASLGVLGGLVVIASFLILGAELLAPKDLLPEGTDVAVDLANLFSEVWGTAGEYLLLAAIVVAIGGSVLANQDGWGRSFADMTLIFLREKGDTQSGIMGRGFAWLNEKTSSGIGKRRFLKRFYVLTITGIIPVGILLVFKDPVKVMSVSGIIAALHTPFIVFAALFVNRRLLPDGLRPGLFFTTAMTLAGLFYLGFAGIYILDLLGVVGQQQQ
ncbi:divalent metal cation transporter [Proteobacteria bacterium 005FR1]|nr:divalent metal cation transporter [Proteobacteria bacterium 005FR1]